MRFSLFCQITCFFSCDLLSWDYNQKLSFNTPFLLYAGSRRPEQIQGVRNRKHTRTTNNLVHLGFIFTDSWKVYYDGPFVASYRIWQAGKSFLVIFLCFHSGYTVSPSALKWLVSLMYSPFPGLIKSLLKVQNEASEWDVICNRTGSTCKQDIRIYSLSYQHSRLSFITPN